MCIFSWLLFEYIFSTNNYIVERNKIINIPIEKSYEQIERTSIISVHLYLYSKDSSSNIDLN